MFTNVPCCTIWEKIVQNRSPTYVRHVTGAVYWEENVGEAEGKDRKPINSALVIIHENNIGTYMPKPDDRIMRGNIESAVPEPYSLTVKKVNDFRYGSTSVRHIEISAV